MTAANTFGAMRSRTHAVLLLHFTVLIWGFTGILGKLIEQPTLQLVYTRTVIGLLGIAVVALAMRRSLSPQGPDVITYLLTSLLITAHWITFYGAIKISTASIAAACLSTSTVFTALLEPFWYKRKIRRYEVILGLVVIAALLMIFGLETRHRLGIAVATLSALLSAWFNVVNGVLVNRGEALRIGFYELLGVVAVMVPLAWWFEGLPPPLWHLPSDQILYQLALGLVCTTFAFIAGILVMRQLSPFTVMLTVNLEPVYTILIALLIWGAEERMHAGSYIGIVLILACLFLNGWWQKRLAAKAVAVPEPLMQG